MMKAVLRTIFQIAAFCIFLYQMQSSIIKFSEYPIVSETSYIKFKNTSFYICNSWPFNYTLAHSYGYTTKYKYLAGKIENSSTPTWKGKDGNFSWHNMTSHLFNANFSGVRTNIATKPVFNFLSGFCLKANVTEKDEILSVKTKSPIVVYLNPNNNLLELDKSLDTTVWIGPTKGIDYLHTEIFVNSTNIMTLCLISFHDLQYNFENFSARFYFMFKRTVVRSQYLCVRNVLLTIFHGNIKHFGDINMFN